MSEEEAVQEAVKKGLLIYVAEFDESFPDELHWHAWDTHLYCIEGEVRGMDPENPDVVMEPGDYFVVPARVVHAGQIVKKARVVNAFRKDLGRHSYSRGS